MIGPNSPFDLTGRLAVVTGCRRGIGFAMAEALAQAGADIIGVSMNLETDGSAIGRRVQELGRTFTAYRADLVDVAAVAELAQTLSDHCAGGGMVMLTTHQDAPFATAPTVLDVGAYAC